MKPLILIMLLVLGIYSENVFSESGGSCIQSSNPQDGVIVVLFCGPPETLTTYICDDNDTPPVTSGCSCPFAGTVDIPNHCRKVSVYHQQIED